MPTEKQDIKDNDKKGGKPTATKLPAVAILRSKIRDLVKSGNFKPTSPKGKVGK